MRRAKTGIISTCRRPYAYMTRLAQSHNSKPSDKSSCGHCGSQRRHWAGRRGALQAGRQGMRRAIAGTVRTCGCPHAIPREGESAGAQAGHLLTQPIRPLHLCT